jgi:hypothetical protein
VSAFHPRAEDLPEEIAVFPLTGALLLPQGRLPLNIFEPRYLALVSDSLAAGRMFGMIQPDAGQPEGLPGPALHRTGCLGRLASFSETEDGRFLITLVGVCRFHVASELTGRSGYRRVRPDFGPFLADLDLSPPDLGVTRETLMQTLRGYFRARSIEANWEAIEQTPDPALVVTLCMVCPFDPIEKQALLEAATPADRAAMLIALMRMGTHGGAANDDSPRLPS